WQNPAIPWRELERRLSGRPVPDDEQPDRRQRTLSLGDGRGSPAWSRKRPAYEPAPLVRPHGPHVPYAELHTHSSFSFLDGASSPEELAEEAVRLGLEALTIPDHGGVYGLVRFAGAAEQLGLATAFGAELSLDVPVPATQAERMVAARVGQPAPPGRHLLVLARDPQGYASLSRSIGTAQLRGGAKGRPVYDIDELTDAADGHWLILTGCRKGHLRQALETSLDAARLALAELV